jgi:hypothetical protein
MLADSGTNRLDSDRNHSFVAAAVAEAVVRPGWGRRDCKMAALVCVQSKLESKISGWRKQRVNMKIAELFSKLKGGRG